MSKEFYKKGYGLAIDNANNLHLVAENAINLSQIGVACSLNILAAEEAVKAIFLLLKSQYPNNEIEDFEKIFRDHKKKHDYISRFLIANIVIQSINLEWIEKLEPMLDSMLKIAENLSTSVNEFIAIKEDLSWLKEHSKKKEIDIKGALLWVKRANEDKNRGFYVDLKGNKWSSPADISGERYNEEKMYTQFIIHYAEALDELFTRTLLMENSIPLNSFTKSKKM